MKLNKFQFGYANRGKEFHRHRGTQLRLPRFISSRTVIKLRLEIENVGCSNLKNQFFTVWDLFFNIFKQKESWFKVREKPIIYN